MNATMYTVSSLVRYMKGTIDRDQNLQSILLKGEVSNFTNHRSGHWYFTLKDASAKISCVMFASYARRSHVMLKEGMGVIVHASVSMYEAQGNIQLYVNKVEMDGLGELYLQFEAVKAKLAQEGLFALERKKPLPSYPMDIGIITAKTGAAIQDMLTTIARRWPLAHVCIYPTLVQGAQASKAIIQSIYEADAKHHDVLLLARGGGAIEDLWCFNEEALARVIAMASTVIVTGVGHESDTTLVDYVSDARAPTPTGAAELITPDINEVNATIHTYKNQLLQQIHKRMEVAKTQLSICKQHRYLQDPLSYIAQEQMRLAMMVKDLGVVDTQAKALKTTLQRFAHQIALQAQRMQGNKRSTLQQHTSALHTTMTQYQQAMKALLQQRMMVMDAYSPLNILKRGYDIAYHDQKIVKSIQDVHEEDAISLRMQDGYIHAVVKKKEAL